jgi:SEC-C motif-containing protein
MRSRFAAFAVGDTSYLLRTWHPSTRPATLELDEQQRWTHLDVIDTVAGGLFDQTGIVEFQAHYRHGRQRGTLHERSRFARIDGAWFYLDGQPGQV